MGNGAREPPSPDVFHLRGTPWCGFQIVFWPSFTTPRRGLPLLSLSCPRSLFLRFLAWYESRSLARPTIPPTTTARSLTQPPVLPHPTHRRTSCQCAGLNWVDRPAQRFCRLAYCELAQLAPAAWFSCRTSATMATSIADSSKMVLARTPAPWAPAPKQQCAPIPASGWPSPRDFLRNVCMIDLLSRVSIALYF